MNLHKFITRIKLFTCTNLLTQKYMIVAHKRCISTCLRRFPALQPPPLTLSCDTTGSLEGLLTRGGASPPSLSHPCSSVSSAIFFAVGAGRRNALGRSYLARADSFDLLFHTLTSSVWLQRPSRRDLLTLKVCLLNNTNYHNYHSIYTALGLVSSPYSISL